jgi:hypothetical protein
MDAFNLHWPGGEATLQTDGQRCRIVWRPASGMGGSIENSEQAKRRVAAGLRFAPGLLDELKAAGHVDLAAELERISPPTVPVAPAAARPERTRTKPVVTAAPVTERAVSAPPPEVRPSVAPAAKGEKKTAEGKSRLSRWLDALPPATFEACGVRRAAKWHHGKTWPEGLSLKTPLAGKGDWVLKIAGDETRYFAAESFAGVCRALAAQRGYATDDFVEAFLEGCKALRQKEVAVAREAWEATAK